MKYFALATAALLAAACSWAGGQAKFVERRGTEEFSGRMIVRPLQHDQLLAKGYTASQAQAVRLAAGDRLADNILRYVPQTDEYIVTVPKGSNENSFSAQLMATGQYQYAEPDWRCYPVGDPKNDPNDPKFSLQWHHKTVKSSAAWTISTGSSTIIVAAVDTGVDKTHPDIMAHRVLGYNSVDRLAEKDGGDVSDVHGHGTHVTGCMGAIGNNGVGVCGMGWNYKLMMCRTTNDSSGGAYVSDMMDGAQWAIEHGASVASVSYSGVDDSSIGTTGTYIKSIGGLLCFAAGNDGRNLSGFSYPDVIVVGASDSSDKKASFSAYGKGVHVFAPGVDILSTVKGGGYEAWSGTSMATPLVNGALALIWSVAPTLTPQAVQDILEANCDNIGSSTIFGHGRINQYLNVQAAKLSAPKHIAAVSAVPFTGAYVAGGLASMVTSGDGLYYDLNSVLFSTGGQAAAVQVTYKITDPRANVRKLKFTAQARSADGKTPIGMVYLYNTVTGVYDVFTVATLNATSNHELVAQAPTLSTPYLAADGTVKAVVRGYTAPTRTTQAPTFMLRVDYIDMSYVLAQ